MQPHYWNNAKKHLSRTCPTLKTLIKRYQGEGLIARHDGFYSLLRAIVGQQISVKAADAVWAKVEKTVRPLTAKQLLATPDDALRACGLSGQKVLYAKNIAAFFIERGIKIFSSPLEGERDLPLQVRGGTAASQFPPTKTHKGVLTPPQGGSKQPEGAYWANLSDEEVIRQLTAIKGIGSWTAEMFLMFHLARPDVLPLKDIGLLKAMNLYYVDAAKLEGKKWLTPYEYAAIAAPWAPYRTVATWYLWRALDPVPVAY
jgi:DNA-3-methyladenine glycosylase II